MKKALFLIPLLLLNSSCSSLEEKVKKETFDMNIYWGIHCHRFYSSSQNKIIKNMDEPNRDDYSASFSLSDEQKEEIIFLLNSIHIYSYPCYPETYNIDTCNISEKDICESVTPSDQYKLELPNLIITTQEDISIKKYQLARLNKKDFNFLYCMFYIIDIIESSEAWKSITKEPTVFYM